MGMLDSITPGVGSIIGAGIGLLGAQQTNDRNAEIAEKNNAWSAAQYAQRYQVMTQDLEKAGLNPMLAYSQNPGAAPSAQQVQFQNPMNSALDAYHKSSERDVMTAQIQNIQADSKLKDEQAKLIASQKLAADADERLKTTSANEATVRMASQLDVGNPTQKALASSYWSQVQVNNANLSKIASEIAANGAYAGQARAAAFKAIQEGRITQADYQRALNQQAFEKSGAGKAKPFTDYGLNSASKAAEIVKPFRSPPSSTTTRTSPWGNSSSTTTYKR